MCKNDDRQAGDKETGVSQIEVTPETLDALSTHLSRCFAFVVAGTRDVGHGRNEAVLLEEDINVQANLVDEQRIAFDMVDGHWE